MIIKSVDKLLSNEELAALAAGRAVNFFQVHGLCCSEAIILVLSKGFGGDMSDELAISVGAGLCGGMGGKECVCGALSGAVVALGGLLAPNRKTGLSKGNMRKTARLLHDNFKKKYGSTCCKDLTEGFVGSNKAKMKNCGKITAETAEMAALILLQKAPGLAKKADLQFLRERETKVSRLLNKVFGK